MTQYVRHSSSKVRAVFGEQITIDDGGEDPKQVDIKSPPNVQTIQQGTTDNEKNLKDQAAHEANRAKSHSLDRGALVGRARSRDQILNPWTWGIVLYISSTPHPKEGVAPVAVCWASAPNSRAVSNEKIDDLILISKPPTETYLNMLKDWK